MRIVISPSHIIGDLVATSKRGALAEITALLPGLDQDELQAALLDREAVGATAIEAGLAVPHAKLAAAEEIQVCFARSQAGIQWGAPDHQLVHLIFLVVAPLHATTTYLETLATLCRFLRDGNNSSRLLRSADDQLGPLLAAAKGLQ